MKQFLKGCNFEIHLKTAQIDSFNGVAFLDRDGVIIKEKNYIKDPREVELNDGIEKVLDLLNQKNFKIIVITNQSGISRGYFDWEDYLAVTEKMLELLDYKNNNIISSIYACGAINKNECNWRKPGIGMISNARSDNLINTKESILIGDKLSDIKTGKNSSINKLFHILTGHGEKEKEKVRNYILNSAYNTDIKSKNLKQFFQSKNLEIIYQILKEII